MWENRNIKAENQFNREIERKKRTSRIDLETIEKEINIRAPEIERILEKIYYELTTKSFKSHSDNSSLGLIILIYFMLIAIMIKLFLIK